MAKANLTTMIAVCPECEELVQILNNNFEYSMKLHKKSHPTIKVEMPLKFEKIGNNSNEEIEVSSNDGIYTLKPLVQKQQCEVDNILSHSSFSTVGDLFGNHQPRTTARKPSLINLLETILPSMPDCVKVHIHFFSETEYSRAICSVCKITVDPISYIPQHIKTKLHEDNIINTLKTLLPLKSKDQMKFVSFYNSNLYCNLCECKIILCSSDLHQSVNNIFTHNAEQSHSNHASCDHNPSQSCCDPATQDHVHLLGPNISEAVRKKKTAFENFSKTNMTMKSRAEFLENSKSELTNLCSPYEEDTTNNTRNTKHMEKLQEDNMQNQTLKTNEKDEKLPTVFDNVTLSVKEVKNLPSSENQVKTKEKLNQAIPPQLVHFGERKLDIDNEISHNGNMESIPVKIILNLTHDHLNQVKSLSKSNNKSGALPKTVDTANKFVSVNQEHLTTTNNFTGAEMTSAEGNYMNSVYGELIKTNALIGYNDKYIEQNKNVFVCKPCNKTHIIANVKDVEGRLVFHFLGLEHILNTKLIAKVGNYYFCKTCCKKNNNEMKKLKSLRSLKNHFYSQAHIRNVERFVPLDPDVMSNINAVYRNLSKTNAVIELNDKYFEQEENVFVCKPCNNTHIVIENVRKLQERLMDHILGLKHNLNTQILFKEGAFYICTICTGSVNNVIPICKLEKRKKLERRIINHTSSQEHMQHIVSMNLLDQNAINGINDRYRELSRSNAVIRFNDKYIEQEENVFVCKLCNNTCIVIENVIELQGRLMDHMKGREHNLNTKLLVKVNNYYVCTICSENNKIKIHKKLKKMEKRIMNHTSCQKHMQNIVLLYSLDPAEICNINEVYKELLRTNEVIRLNDKYIEQEENVFVCKPCNNLPIVIVNVNELERRLMNHILGLEHNLNTKFLAKEGDFYICKICFVNNGLPICNVKKMERMIVQHTSSQGHLQNIVLMNYNQSRTTEDPATISNEVYRELSRSNAVIRLNFKYIEQEGNAIVCKLCNNTCIVIENVKDLEESIIEHIMTLEHDEKLTFQEEEVIVRFLEKTELSDTEIRENLNVLRTEDDIIRCTLCDFTIPSNGENDEIIENLAVHLRESGHNANKKVSNEYIGHTLGNKPHDDISHCFNKLPTKYLEDIEYITFSPFKRFLSCKLCNSMIHPRYLKEHLEELVHTQEKELKKKPNLLSKTTHVVTDQNVLRHLDTLSSLLKKIQLKSPWQK
ncbi:uncharacterized protein LOC128988037 isoform X1 [Macrosteles quadrilineatus]|uniref:uncharacterized protein LOC128988037 isoform X1 n=1 Tax=Macrosteles quadrilineatus TaxID=74068 RepID=UPI0023E11097|nr:uncharacterized protein LOC128988037 isoform X1 [Macrosteles quadrilineatus]XP_054265186.1 uncharacterized protein LOC128988037 isoform X1 [Macrosteles quadrilineatus]